MTCIVTAMAMMGTLKTASVVNSPSHGYNIGLTIIDHRKRDSHPPWAAKKNQKSKFV